MGLTGSTRSKLGRRIVMQFMLAVSLPLVVLGALTHRTLVSQAEAQEQYRFDTDLSTEAMQVFDRLLAARAALRLIMQAGVPPSTLGSPASVLRTITVVGDAPRAGRNHADVDQLALERWWAAASPPAQRGLHWIAQQPGQPAKIVMSVDDANQSSHWLAEIDPGYLWADTFDVVESYRACAFDAEGQPLYCSGAAGAVRPTADADAEDTHLRAAKALFLQKEFGVEDWTFRAMRPRSADATPGFALGSMVVKVVVAALLLVLALSLVQVRRTMGPLQRLLAVTRRLAQQEYSARVELSGDDEFRELGESFNNMATQMDAHIGELHVLSAIDREILDSPDFERLARRVLDHLGRLVPTATVALCEAREGLPLRVRCHRRPPDASVQVTEQPPDAAAWQALVCADGAAHWLPAATPETAWLARLLDVPPGAIYCAAAGHGQTQALLLIATDAEDTDRTRPPHWHRHVEEMRNRVAVAVAAAAHDRQLVHQATHDSLTGLRNRAGLQAALDEALATGTPFAVMFADLDRFKSVNDSMGHQAGDQILCLAAQRLVAVLPADAVVARPGGDEFVVLLPDPASSEHTAVVAQTVCRSLAELFAVEGREIVLGASVGWVLHPDDGASAQELMRHADMAMYCAKDKGRGQAERFVPQMDLAVAQNAWIANDLRLAVERQQLVVHYQPRVDAVTGIADTAEALVRWQHPTHGLVPPALFIEVAEATGAINALGRWVLREACRQIAQWRREGVPIERVSVNLSALQLADATLFDQVEGALEEHGLSAEHLELEITESALVGDQSVAAKLLARLRSRGIAIALDDFGTGYSSMAYLSNMPIDVIKVDRAFVKNLGQDRSADTVTRAIVTLAHSLGLGLVAEGVETEEQAEMLRAMGCQQLQGYLYSRPVPAGDYPLLACVAAREAVAA